MRSDIKYMYKDLYIDEKLQVLPYSYFKDLEYNHVKQFCVENGIYCLPTIELLNFIKEEIGEEERVIEIGAGHGAIARELGIKATDSKLQNRVDIKELYIKGKQPIVRYGDNIEMWDGEKAVCRFKPNIVIAAWVTHKYNPKQHVKEGNIWGVNESNVIEKARKYIFVGNTDVHLLKPIMDIPHRTIEPDWLVSRGIKPNTDRIWVWER